MHKRQLLSQNGLRHDSQLLLLNGNSSLFSSFLCRSTIFVSFLKKKIGAVNAAPISAIKLPHPKGVPCVVADFRRQLAQGRVQFVPLITNAVSFVLAETAWTMTASVALYIRLQRSRKASQSARPRKGIPPPILWVVSKCALRDSSKAAKAYAFNRLFSSIFTSSSSIV